MEQDNKGKFTSPVANIIKKIPSDKCINLSTTESGGNAHKNENNKY